MKSNPIRFACALSLTFLFACFPLAESFAEVPQWVTPEPEVNLRDVVLRGINYCTETGHVATQKESKMTDFVVAGSNVFYLTGACKNGAYCALAKYNVETGDDDIVLNNLHSKLETEPKGSTVFVNYSKTTKMLQIINMAWDSKSGSGGIYMLSSENLNLTKLETLTETRCGREFTDANGYFSECTAEQTVQNERFDALRDRYFLNAPPHTSVAKAVAKACLKEKIINYIMAKALKNKQPKPDGTEKIKAENFRNYP